VSKEQERLVLQLAARVEPNTERDLDRLMHSQPNRQARFKLLQSQTGDGNTPLHLALINKSVPIAQTLYVYCYGIEQRTLYDFLKHTKNNNGKSIMQLALDAGDFSVVEDLLGLFSDIYRRALLKHVEHHSLHAPAMLGAVELVKEILDKCKDDETQRKLLNDTGDSHASRTPEQVAADYNQNAVKDLLSNRRVTLAMKSRARRNSSPFKLISKPAGSGANKAVAEHYLRENSENYLPKNGS